MKPLAHTVTNSTMALYLLMCTATSLQCWEYYSPSLSSTIATYKTQFFKIIKKPIIARIIVQMIHSGKFYRKADYRQTPTDMNIKLNKPTNYKPRL